MSKRHEPTLVRRACAICMHAASLANAYIARRVKPQGRDSAKPLVAWLQALRPRVLLPALERVVIGKRVSLHRQVSSLYTAESEDASLTYHSRSWAFGRGCEATQGARRDRCHAGGAQEGEGVESRSYLLREAIDDALSAACVGDPVIIKGKGEDVLRALLRAKGPLLRPDLALVLSEQRSV